MVCILVAEITARCFAPRVARLSGCWEAPYKKILNIIDTLKLGINLQTPYIRLLKPEFTVVL